MTEPRNLRLANEAWEALLKAQSSVMRGFASERMWDELSLNEYDVLYTLRKAGCALRISDLNAAVLLSQPALSRLVDRLAGRGFVTRTSDPADRRAVLVTLTGEGAAAQRRTGGRHARSVEERMRAALTPDELRALRELCDRLAAAGEPPSPSDPDPTRGAAAQEANPR